MVHGLETMAAMNDAATSKVKRVVVCHDLETEEYAMYVDGFRAMDSFEIDPNDFAQTVGQGVPFTLEVREFDMVEMDENSCWHERLEDVKECE